MFSRGWSWNPHFPYSSSDSMCRFQTSTLCREVSVSPQCKLLSSEPALTVPASLRIISDIPKSSSSSSSSTFIQQQFFQILAPALLNFSISWRDISFFKLTVTAQCIKLGGSQDRDASSPLLFLSLKSSNKIILQYSSYKREWQHTDLPCCSRCHSTSTAQQQITHLCLVLGIQQVEKSGIGT